MEILGSGAFSNCTALEKMELPDSITKISDNLFCDCTSLWKVSIPESVTEISDYAFLECTSLKSIDIPDSVEAIGDHAIGFYDEETEETDQNGNNKLEFLKINDFTINANFDTAARDYAKSNGIDINYLDGNKDIPKIIAVVAGAVVIAGVIVFLVIMTLRKKKKEHEYYEN